MSYIDVYIEHNSIQLNTTFTYVCKEPISVGCRVRVPFGALDLIGFVAAIDVQPRISTVKEVLEVIDKENNK